MTSIPAFLIRANHLLPSTHSRGVTFGKKALAFDVPEIHQQDMQDHLDKVHSPLFQWMATSNPLLKRWTGIIVNWAYWLWQSIVKDLKHIQHSLFKSSKPFVEKP